MACSMPYSQCRRHEKSRQKLKRFLFQRQQYSARQSTGDTLSSWKRATLAAARDTWPDSQNNLERQPREVDGDYRPRSNFQLRDGLAFAEAARKYRSGFSTPAFAHTTTSLNKRTNTDPSADNAESESSTARQIHRPDTPSVTRTSSRNPRNGERQTPDASATISTKDEVAPLQQEAPLATPATTHVVTANARPLHTDNLNWPVAHGITLTAGEERQNTKPGRKISQKRRRDVSHFPADQDLDPEVSPPRKQVRFDAEGGSLLSDTSASSCDLRTRTPSDEEEGPTPTLTPTNHEPGVTAKAIYFVNAPLGRDRDRTLKTRARPEYTLDQSPRRRKRPAEIHPEHLRAIIGNEKGEELLLGLTDICERVILFGDELEILPHLPGSPVEERAATREDARRPGEVRRILDGVLAVWHQYKSEPHQQDGMLSRLKTYLYSLPRDMMVRVMADVTNSFSRTWHGAERRSWNGAKRARLSGPDEDNGSRSVHSPPAYAWISDSEVDHLLEKVGALNKFFEDLGEDVKQGLGKNDAGQTLTSAADFVGGTSFRPKPLVTVDERKNLLPNHLLNYESRAFLVLDVVEKVHQVTDTMYRGKAPMVMRSYEAPSPETKHVEYSWSRPQWLDVGFVRTFLRDHAVQLCTGACPEKTFPREALQLVIDDLQAVLDRRIMPSLMRTRKFTMWDHLKHSLSGSISAWPTGITHALSRRRVGEMPGAFPPDTTTDEATDEASTDEGDGRAEVETPAQAPATGAWARTTLDVRTQTERELHPVPSPPLTRSSSPSPSMTEAISQRVVLGLRRLKRKDTRTRWRRQIQDTDNDMPLVEDENAWLKSKEAPSGFYLRWLTRQVRENAESANPRRFTDVISPNANKLKKNPRLARAWDVIQRRYGPRRVQSTPQLRQPETTSDFARKHRLHESQPARQHPLMVYDMVKTEETQSDSTDRKAAGPWSHGMSTQRRRDGTLDGSDDTNSDARHDKPGGVVRLTFPTPDDSEEELQLSEQVRLRLRIAEEERERLQREAEEKERQKKREEQKRLEEERRRIEAKRRAEEKKRAEEEERSRAEEERAKLGPNGMRRPRGPLFPPLSEELSAAVDGSTSQEGEICHTPDAQLRREDFQKLLPPTAWLNDEIVNGCLLFLDRFINDAAGVTDVRSQTRKNLVMSSFFYSIIQKKGGKQTERAMRRVGIHKDNFLDVETILIPVCENSHWTLLVIKPKEQAVANIDSLHPPGSRAKAQVVLNWIKALLGDDLYEEDKWKYVRYRTPVQTNGWDCGVHTILNGMCMSLGVDPMESYTARELPKHRRNIAAMFLNGKGFREAFDLSSV